MPTIHCATIVKSLTGLAADSVVMDMSFEVTTADEATALLIQDALHDFWSVIGSDVGFGVPTISPSEMFSDDTRNPNFQFRYYSVNEATEDKTFIVLVDQAEPLAGSEPLPEEVSLRLTAHGALSGGATDRRRMGGFFIGGGIPMALSEVVDGRTRPVAATHIALRTNARVLLDASDAAAGWSWVIRSPTYHANFPVVGGWVDNAWDTIRSRGPASTARNSWTATP